jgi:hypothetical protein
VTVLSRAVLEAIKKAEKRPDIVEIRARGLSPYIYLIVSYVQTDYVSSYSKPDRAEIMEAWLMLLLADADTTKKVITDAITDAVTNAITNAMPGAIESVSPASPPKEYPDMGFPGRKVES